MELDDCKAGWAMLEKSLAINERLLHETLTAKARRALWPYIAWHAIEVALGLAMLFAIVPVVGAHLDSPRYLIAGLATIALVAGVTAMTAYLVVASARLDHAGPVGAMQRAIAQLKLVEYRSSMWAILGGVVVWLPGLLLGFEAVTGVDALARVDLGYLVWNIMIGLAVLGLGFGVARRYARTGATRGKLIDALSGRALRVADAHLADLAQFERE